MSNAERQKRYRDRQKPRTQSERFRLKLYHLITWFGLYLSHNEITETLEEFGVAWAFENIKGWYNEKGQYRNKEQPLTRAEILQGGRDGDFPDLERVLQGERLMGNPGERIGDEARYQADRERRAKEQAEWDVKFAKMKQALLEECDGDENRANLLIFGRMVSNLVNQAA